MSDAPLPTFFLSHGGGPWPYMDGPFREHFKVLETSLRGLIDTLPTTPRAVLVVSGHWEAQDFTVSSAAEPGMLYDYGGFPPHTYRVKYAAPGAPTLAARVSGLLTEGGMVCRLDPDRGFDHGTFSLMEPIRPQADIPVVQLSLQSSLDPARHIEMGRLLTPLRREGVLILGSGLSYHNLGLMDERSAAPSGRFDAWLQDTLVAHSGAYRLGRLSAWTHAPSARVAHPREDHLLPLMVAVGAAESEPGHCIYHEAELFGSMTASSFSFGAR